MKKFIGTLLILVGLSVTWISCEVQEYSDLNNPETEGFEQNLSRGDLQDLVGGILSSSRANLDNYFDDCGVLGREWWRFASSDPRFTSDLLGGGSAILDNNSFYITSPWASRYRTVKNANLILGYLNSQDLSGTFTEQEINATKGFLNTFIGYELLLNLNLTNEGGIRLDVADETNLGPFVSKIEALAGIRAYLDAGAQFLQNGGAIFPFVLSSGFEGFDTPTTFLEANRAISARVAMYQGDEAAVLSYLDDSFFVLDGSDLYTGIYYVYTEEQTDILNTMFFPVESTTANARIAVPTFVTEAEAGDTRLDKVALRSEPLTLDDLTGQYAVFRYKSNVDPIPMIRNEELILLYAEANITIDPAEAVNALNIIRASAGLPAYSGPTDTNSLVTEMLTQRRYSLFAEGHRWIDLRRYGKLEELPLARQEDDVFTHFPIPLAENQ